jgi:hypothetical protein
VQPHFLIFVPATLPHTHPLRSSPPRGANVAVWPPLQDPDDWKISECICSLQSDEGGEDHGGLFRLAIHFMTIYPVTASPSKKSSQEWT